MLYFLVYIGIGIWVYFDAKKRLEKHELAWSIATAIVGPIVVPFYLAKRNLKPNEVREGGLAWNVLKFFALFWTVTMAIATIHAISSASDTVNSASSDAERAGAGIGIGIALVIVFFLWFFVTAGAVMVGFLVKKTSVVERGPTGALAGSPAVPVAAV